MPKNENNKNKPIDNSAKVAVIVNQTSEPQENEDVLALKALFRTAVETRNFHVG